ncbi:DNA internalization-related competence protein ComEC/Rec2 [Vibrio albus]|uniref:DNA internalization-related competence protein ComEC/Rec2 n=1 Tax=Vibrio albus TaxID=2200953 RepID=A0A2U3BDU8_9VIBR|nr:DNA internalization-related competence protein ComEC/Rec2 [Vibrio albus]PWI34947.1 DNA internalization-related competence protein ComEC/Rec2 [Vibrio albus]
MMTLLLHSWNLICFFVVIVSVQYWQTIPSMDWIVVCAALFIVSYYFYPFRWFRGGIAAIIVLIISMNQFKEQVETVFQDGLNITITGQVDSLFKEISHGQIVLFSVHKVNEHDLDQIFLPRIKLRVSSGDPFLLGEQWKLEVRLKPVYGKLNEAGFDEEKYYVSQYLHAKANLKGVPERLHSSSSFRLMLHQRVTRQTEGLVAQPLLMALTFGDRNTISPPLWKDLKSSGLIHLVAISGLHIGLAFMLGWIVGKPLSLLSPYMLKAPIITGVLFAGIYAWLAGFSLPAIRALTMCALVSIVPMIRLTYSRWQVLLLTLCTVLCIDPFAPFSASFWMSFGAVTSIYLLLGSSVFRRSRKIKRLVLMQCVLAAVMIPVTGYFFSGLSAVSPVYNLIFVPWFSFIIVPLVFIGLFFSFLLPDISVFVWQMADYALIPVLSAIRYSEGAWVAISATLISLAALVTLVWIFSPLLSSVQKKWLLVSGCLLVLFDDRKAGWQVDVLDVGQGLALLISKAGGHILYDTGERWETGSIAESVIAPVLVKRGVRQLDGLILSHTDSDHAGGRQFIERQFIPKMKWASERIVGYQPCIKGTHWYWRALRFEAVWPPKQVARAYNSHSCVVRVTDGQFSILLTGDIEAVSEYLLAREGKDKLDSDIMLVPHHGSDTSSTGTFIEQVTPEVAIASLAKGNFQGMPSVNVLNVYASRDIKWLDTGESGQITVEITENNWQISSFRATDSSPWYRQILRKRVE